jgi:hypothetical protein
LDHETPVLRAGAPSCSRKSRKARAARER